MMLSRNARPLEGRRCAAMMMVMSFVLLGVSLLTVPVSADVLTLNNGDELFGTIVRANDRETVFKAEDGEKTFPAADILKLEFDRWYGVPGEDSPEQVKDPVITKVLAKVPTAADYPQARLVDILHEEEFDIASDSTFTRTFRRIFVVLQEDARTEADHSFSYMPDRETFELHHARAISPGQPGMLGLLGGSAGKVRNTSSRTVAEEVDFYQLPQYQRRRTVKFSVPEVSIGTIVDWKYSIKRIKPDPLEPFLAQMLFQEMEPCQLRRLVVRGPADLALNIDLKEAGVAVHRQGIKRDAIFEHVFSAFDVPGLPGEPRMADPQRFVSQVLCAPKTSAKELAAQYRHVLDETAGAAEAATAEAPLQAALAAACASATTPQDKARRIYDYLAREITTVGITPHQYSFRPLAPAAILETKQASYLDKAFLYHVLLRLAGIEHTLSLLRPAGAGTWCEGVPHLAQATYLGIQVTGETAPFAFNLPFSDQFFPDMIPADLQGATGIGLADGEPVAVPLSRPEEEEDFYQVEAALNAQGHLQGKVVYRPRGANGAELRQLKHLTNDQIRVALETNLGAEFPGATLETFETSNILQSDGPPEIRYTFTIEHYARRSGRDLFVIPLPVMKSAYSTGDVGIPERKTPMFWPTLSRQRWEVSLALPDGYELYALPQGNWDTVPGLGYHSTFGYEMGRVLFRDVFERNLTSVLPGEYTGLKSVLETRGRTTGRWIVAIRRASSPVTAPEFEP